MKKVILIGLIAAVPLSCSFAGAREDLMARMGFSKEEIAKDAATHKASNGPVKSIPGKNDPNAAATVLKEADEINELRSLRALQQQAEEVEKKAGLSKAKQREAEEKSEVARREARRIGLTGNSNSIYANALDGRDNLEREAQKAREAAEEDASKASQARSVATKARADEAKLEKERLTRVSGR